MLIEDNISCSEYAKMCDEYGDDYVDELLLNQSKAIFERVLDYIVPFRESFDNPDSDRHNKVDSFIVSEFNKYLKYLLSVADSTAPIKELEVMTKTLDNLMISICFSNLYASIDEHKNQTINDDDLNTFQVCSNIYTSTFLSILNHQTLCYIQDNKINLQD